MIVIRISFSNGVCPAEAAGRASASDVDMARGGEEDRTASARTFGLATG